MSSGLNSGRIKKRALSSVFFLSSIVCLFVCSFVSLFASVLMHSFHSSSLSIDLSFIPLIYLPIHGPSFFLYLFSCISLTLTPSLCLLELYRTGDFWHVRGALCVDLLNRVLASLKQWTQPVIMIPGNHDQVRGEECRE
jgi:hypothetical protein